MKVGNDKKWLKHFSPCYNGGKSKLIEVDFYEKKCICLVDFDFEKWRLSDPLFLTWL